MKMKSIISVILCVLLIGLMISGCGSSSDTNTETSSAGGTVASSGATGASSQDNGPISEIKLPIVDKPLTLSLWAPLSDKVANTNKNYGELPMFQELEKRTGIHINFMHPPVGQEQDQLNLMLASNDLPDMIHYDWALIAGGPAKLLSENQIIKLNDYVAKYAPSLNGLMKEDPNIKKQLVLDDGTIYDLPYMTGTQMENAWYGPQLRKDWLDKLQLKAPATIDEWYNVLTAFRDKDPNDNGKKDEIPFTGKGNNGLGILALSDFAPAWGIINDFSMKNGKVVYGPIEPEFKEFLTVMNKWYNEKLIDPDIATSDAKAFDYKITNNLAGSYYGAVNGNMGRYLNMMKDKDPKFDLTSSPYPTGPAGKPYIKYDLNLKVQTVGTAITSKCKNVKEAIEWLDYGFSKDGNILMNFGIEGKSFSMVNGVPTYTDEVWKPTNGMTWDQVMAQYSRAIDDWTMIIDKGYTEQKLRTPQQQQAVLKDWSVADSSLCLPPVTLTDEEAKTVASIMNQVETYRNEMMAKFVMSKAPLSDFDKYVVTLKGMDIDKVIKIKNDAYDRYQKR